MDEYEKDLKRFDDNLVRPTVMLPFVFVAIAMVVGGYYLGATFNITIRDLLQTVIGLLVFAIATFIPMLRFNKAHGIWLTLYHLALIGIGATLLPVFSPFLAFWIIILYLTTYYYKKVGLFLSALLMAGTIIGGMFYQKVPFNSQNIFLAASWLAVIIASTIVFYSVIRGTFQNRGLLASKMIKAQYEHERVLSLINAMHDAVISTDENGVISIFNSAALDLINTNIGPNNEKIDNILRLTDINKQPVRIIEYAKSIKSSSSKLELYFDASENDRRTLEINVSRTTLFSPISQEKGYTFVMRDITEEKSLREERDDFVSVVSHELRTPIAVAEANTAMAQLQFKNPRYKQADLDKSLENAHRQILFLSEMINDLATLSKAETDKNKIEIEKFSLEDLMNELDITFRPKADAKGLGFNIRIEPALPQMSTSRLYVKDILQNFISNAIKYTNKGGVEISVKSTSDNLIQFAVKDTGMGITKAEQSKLFQKFWRSEDIHTRETEGTGLGLYIASKLAKELGADIKVESVKDTGSTFYLTVPVKIAKNDKLEVTEKEHVTASNVKGG